MGLIKITPADRWFSIAVRERADWMCERCGRKHTPPTTALHCAHWHSRGSWSVRFDPSNAAALCYGCHQYTSVNRETEHRPLMLRLVGDMELDRLAYDKNRPANGIKRRVKEIGEHYRREVDRLRTMRAEGVGGRIEIAPWEAD